MSVVGLLFFCVGLRGNSGPLCHREEVGNVVIIIRWISHLHGGVHVGRPKWPNRSRLSSLMTVTGSHRVQGQQVNDSLRVFPFSCTPSFVPSQGTSGHLDLLPSTIDVMFEETLAVMEAFH